MPIEEPLLKELRKGGAKVNVPLQSKKKGKSAGNVHLIVQGDFDNDGDIRAGTSMPIGFGRVDPRPGGYPDDRDHDRHEHRYPSPAALGKEREGGRDEYARGMLEDQRRLYERDATTLQSRIVDLERELEDVKSRNQYMLDEQRAAVEPLKWELKNNRVLLAQVWARRGARR